MRDIHVEVLDRALLDGVHPLPDEPARERVDVGLIPLFSDARPFHGLAGLIDWRVSGRLSAVARSGFCTSEIGEQLLIPGDRRLPADRLVLVGLGPRETFDVSRARAVGGQLVKISRDLAARTVLIALGGDGLDRSLVEAAFEGVVAAIEAHAHTDAEADPETPAAEAEDVTAPASQAEVRWWIATDESVVARLRRVLSGPPRAAQGGSGLHT